MEAVIKTLERQIKKSVGYFFEPAWRKKVGELLAVESKYARLVEWLDGQIESVTRTLPLFSPADRLNGGYTCGFYNYYKEQLGKLSLLVSFKEYLISASDEETRANIEYSVCKEFGLHYSEELKSYL